VRPYGEVTGKSEPRLATRETGGKKPHRYRRAKRKAEEVAERRRTRKRARCQAKREISRA